MSVDDREGFAAFLLRMRGSGFSDKPLTAAIEATPRRAFVSSHHQDATWGAGMIPIDCGEAIEGLDLQASILHALGMDHEALTYRHQGRDHRLTDVAGVVVEKLFS